MASNPDEPLRTARVPEGVRVYAVGDIHGRADLLDGCLARIDADKARRPVARAIEVFLGDSIDRGPDTRGVIDRLITRESASGVVTLSGNHEGMIADALDDPALVAFWLGNGGRETLASYGITVPARIDAEGAGAIVAAMRDRIPAAHQYFVRTLGDTFRCGDYLFVHAGIRPGVPLDAQEREDLRWIRNAFLDSTLDHGVVVVHGHTPVPEVDVRANRINIDTGAYATGRLTCLVIEEDSIALLEG